MKGGINMKKKYYFHKRDNRALILFFSLIIIINIIAITYNNNILDKLSAELSILVILPFGLILKKDRNKSYTSNGSINMNNKSSNFVGIINDLQSLNTQNNIINREKHINDFIELIESVYIQKQPKLKIQAII